MCGIVGIISAAAGQYTAMLERMLQLQQHRGPDETGTYISDTCLLGHNRLSIIDLKTGQQPMASADGRYTIVFNGEIYGYKALKKSLGYAFKTASDTEVLLALFIEKGEGMLQYLNGMFSFAIWDSHTKRLFFARDRVGEKPFYYYQDKEKFIFASEVGTIADAGEVNLALDMASVAHYFSKLCIHPAHSVYEQIKSLRAGHCGWLCDGKLEIKQYWSIPQRESEISFLEAAEELELLLRKSVAEQLIADVPLSIFLSGGLDSSSIAAQAAALDPAIDALCYRMGDGLDEIEYARDVAAMHSMKLKEISDYTSKNIVDLLHDSVRCYREPYADPSSIPTMKICSEAAKFTKVVLSGDGADELFGGYVSRYKPGIYMQRLLGKSAWRIKSARLLYGLMNRLGCGGDVGSKSLAAYYLKQGYGIADAADQNGSILKDKELQVFGLYRHAPIWPATRDTGNAAMYLDLLNYLPGDILVKIDRAAMFVGLETRAPFLSKDILDFALSLPASYKITEGCNKRIMRTAFENSWPESVRHRSKQGFGSPVKRWLQDPRMLAFKSEIYQKSNPIYQVLDARFINLYKDDVNIPGWAMLNFAVWCDKYL